MRSRLRRRPAFSLVELLVALVLFASGALVVVATSGLVGRAIGEGARRTQVARLARTTLDSLEALPCGAVGPGRDSLPGVSIAWTVDTLPGARRVRQQLRVAVRGGTSVTWIEGMVRC